MAHIWAVILNRVLYFLSSHLNGDVAAGLSLPYSVALDLEWIMLIRVFYSDPAQVGEFGNSGFTAKPAIT